ncbi:MAG: hypothetical protein JKY67_21880 [Pseudomonadales bacterium]|nr:hypothetical protein [Pseudomonadales bacterium]
MAVPSVDINLKIPCGAYPIGEVLYKNAVANVNWYTTEDETAATATGNPQRSGYDLTKATSI